MDRSCSSKRSLGGAEEQWAPGMDAVKEATDEEELVSKTMAEMSALSFRPGQDYIAASQLTQAPPCLSHAFLTLQHLFSCEKGTLALGPPLLCRA